MITVGLTHASLIRRTAGPGIQSCFEKTWDRLLESPEIPPSLRPVDLLKAWIDGFALHTTGRPKRSVLHSGDRKSVV